ncbi:39S ribosomal protein L17, mitochondrial isoform X1 [Tachyglossus aculeatus]|uniref:39S ribosomal protein L17, mitochondrial isoform X1 n=1 Tax=Tachyglossus aculeatus TaxID=9261 RepID=UPI0018F7895D|nr:39S ribosomal protein L17, mitochondrial isoform X1 [Tachyglossus aculeatus]
MRLSGSLGISHGRVFRRLGLGPESRINLLRNLLTGLVRHERIETTWARADELRGYAERIIDYGKLGDTNEKAMRMADFWLTEKDLIPKLFQTLAPRFRDRQGSYTLLQRIPNRSNLDRAKMAVIEYRGNPLPPLPLPRKDGNGTLLNQLLWGYRRDLAGAGSSPVGPPGP